MAPRCTIRAARAAHAPTASASGPGWTCPRRAESPPQCQRVIERALGGDHLLDAFKVRQAPGGRHRAVATGLRRPAVPDVLRVPGEGGLVGIPAGPDVAALRQAAQ